MLPPFSLPIAVLPALDALNIAPFQEVTNVLQRREVIFATTIGVYDSVEAFGEIRWHAFWPEKYRNDRTELGAVDDLDGNRGRP